MLPSENLVNKLVLGIFSPLVIYENVDIVLVFIEILESNPLWFIETLISFIRAYVYMPDLK